MTHDPETPLEEDENYKVKYFTFSTGEVGITDPLGQEQEPLNPVGETAHKDEPIVLALNNRGPRWSFPNFDKYNRCPTWSGSRMKWGNEKYEGACNSGSIIARNPKYLAEGYPTGGGWRFKFHRCSECQVLVLPYVSRYLFPHNIYRYWNRRYLNWKALRPYRLRRHEKEGF